MKVYDKEIYQKQESIKYTVIIIVVFLLGFVDFVVFVGVTGFVLLLLVPGSTGVLVLLTNTLN